MGPLNLLLSLLFLMDILIPLEDLVILPRDSCSVAKRKKETYYPVVPPSGSYPWDLPLGPPPSSRWRYLAITSVGRSHRTQSHSLAVCALLPYMGILIPLQAVSESQGAQKHSYWAIPGEASSGDLYIKDPV